MHSLDVIITRNEQAYQKWLAEQKKKCEKCQKSSCSAEDFNPANNKQLGLNLNLNDKHIVCESK